MTPRRGLALAAAALLVASCSGQTQVTQGKPVSSPSAASSSVSGPWDDDVSALPKSGRSDAVIAALTKAGGWGNGNVLQTDFQIPIFVADANTPRMQVIGLDDYCDGGQDCDAVPAEMPVPADANTEGSQDLSCDVPDNDCHLLVVDPDAKKLYELYQANKVGEQMTAHGFFVWDLMKKYPDTLRGEQCTSADAAGFPIAALTPTADEVASGELTHAVRFILPNDRMKENVFVAPATHAGGPKNADPDAPPYGVNLRLRSDFDVSSFNDAQKVVIAAMKKYGMYLSDGGEIALTFADDRTTSAKWADLGIDAQSFKGIAVDDFDVVDHGDEVQLTYDCARNP